jgi:L-ascorbate metabolism protein UlaG (beta-lactamase superfamily)
MGISIEWFGCSTYRLKIDDLIIFLDAYLDRPATAPDVGLVTSEVTECDYILVGHSHWDHLWGAETIIRNTGATLIGSYETARVMIDQEDIAENHIIPVAGTERLRLNDDVTVTAFPSLHSHIWIPTQNGLGRLEDVCVGHEGVFYQDRLELLEQRFALREATVLPWSKQTPRGDGGALCYLIESPYGSIFFKDTMGHYVNIVKELDPDVALLAAAGRGNIDGEPVQGSGVDFLMDEIALLDPASVILGHYDDFAGSGNPALDDLEPVKQALTETNLRANLIEMDFGQPTMVL